MADMIHEWMEDTDSQYMVEEIFPPAQYGQYDSVYKHQSSSTGSRTHESAVAESDYN